MAGCSCPLQGKEEERETERAGEKKIQTQYRSSRTRRGMEESRRVKGGEGEEEEEPQPQPQQAERRVGPVVGPPPS